MFSLLSPLPGLPWYLLPLWPLIFWRIQRLKAWFRAAGGPGSQMLWGVMWNGRVVVLQLSDDLSGHRPGIFRAPVSDRLRLALVAASARVPGARRGLRPSCPDVPREIPACAGNTDMWGPSPTPDPHRATENPVPSSKRLHGRRKRSLKRKEKGTNNITKCTSGAFFSTLVTKLAHLREG